MADEVHEVSDWLGDELRSRLFKVEGNLLLARVVRGEVSLTDSSAKRVLSGLLVSEVEKISDVACFAIAKIFLDNFSVDIRDRLVADGELLQSEVGVGPSLLYRWTLAAEYALERVSSVSESPEAVSDIIVELNDLAVAFSSGIESFDDFPINEVRGVAQNILAEFLGQIESEIIAALYEGSADISAAEAQGFVESFRNKLNADITNLGLQRIGSDLNTSGGYLSHVKDHQSDLPEWCSKVSSGMPSLLSLYSRGLVVLARVNEVPEFSDVLSRQLKNYREGSLGLAVSGLFDFAGVKSVMLSSYLYSGPLVVPTPHVSMEDMSDLLNRMRAGGGSDPTDLNRGGR